MCALEGRKNKHQLLCKTSLTGFEFLSWLGVGNRQLRPEMGTGEQMPGETRSGQGNKSQHFPNTDYNSSLWPSLTGLTAVHCWVSRELKMTVGTRQCHTPGPGRVMSSVWPARRLWANCGHCRAWPRPASTGEHRVQSSTWPPIHGPHHHYRLTGWSEQLCMGNTDPSSNPFNIKPTSAVSPAQCCVLDAVLKRLVKKVIFSRVFVYLQHLHT